jgi:hypothetical protein
METCKSQSQAKYGPQELKLQKKIREKSSNLFGIFFIKILKHEIFWDGVEFGHHRLQYQAKIWP